MAIHCEPTAETKADIRAMARALVKAGYVDHVDIVEKIRSTIEEHTPLLPSQIRDIISGYGQVSKPTQSELQTKINQIKAEMRRVSAAENAEAEDEKRNERKQRSLQKQIDSVQAQLDGRRATKPAKPTESWNEQTRALADQLANLKAELAQSRKPDPTIARNKTRQAQLQKQLVEARNKLETGNFDKRPPPPKPTYSAETIKLQAEVQLAKNEVDTAIRKLEYQNRSLLRKMFDTLGGGLNLSRAIMTSFDLSAVLRQGGFIALGRPVLAAKSVWPMLKAFRRASNQVAIEQEIQGRPNADLYKKAGLHLSEAGGLSAREEQYMSGLADRLPFVAGSSRAFTTFINKLRADSFDTMVAALAESDIPTQVEMEAIANYINVATGRGRLGGRRGELAADWLAVPFFAPRLVASRFNLLAGQPLWGGTARTRGLIAMQYARYLTGVSVVLGLGYLAFLAGDHDDDEVFIEFDPRSSNFGKMRFGNTFVDPLSGLAQATTVLARVLTGVNKGGAGQIKPLRPAGRLFDEGVIKDKPDFGEPNTFDIAANFMRTKLSPVFGAGATLLTGENLIGEPATVKGTLGGLVSPLSLQNIGDIMVEHGAAAGTAIEALNLLGFGIQYRGPDSLVSDRYSALSAQLDKIHSEVMVNMAAADKAQWPQMLAAAKAKYPVLVGMELEVYQRDGKYGNEGDFKTDADNNPKFDYESGVMGQLEGVPHWDGARMSAGEGIADRVKALDKAINALEGASGLTGAQVSAVTDGLDQRTITRFTRSPRAVSSDKDLQALSDELKSMRRREKQAAVDLLK